jgi:hypothetical protein
MRSLADIIKQLYRLFQRKPIAPPPLPSPPTPEEPEETLTPVRRKLLVMIFNPLLANEGNSRFSAVMGWMDPVKMANDFIADLREVSNGYALFDVAEQHELDYLPAKKDGFTYKLDDFVRCCRLQSGFHRPDEVDYYQVLRDFNLLEKVQDGQVDEVWVFAPPYSGFYESTMAGEGAFFCNSNPIPETSDCKRRFIIMGFNYERGLGEMWESMGHRAENVLQQVYRYRQGALNLWERFTRIERLNPGQAEIGTIHYAPNSTHAYEWDNPTPVLSGCDNWSRYPDLGGSPRKVTCEEWGSGDTRLHHTWWFRYLPHFAGLNGGISCNWWKYVIDPNTIK